MGNHWRKPLVQHPSDRAFVYFTGLAFGVVTTVATIFAVSRFAL
jgi:hypothetical protein